MYNSVQIHLSFQSAEATRKPSNLKKLNIRGAHLANIVALTPTIKLYQPGFESLDCEIQACVSINSMYDLTTKRPFRMRKWITKKCIGLNTQATTQQLESLSPRCLLAHVGKMKRKWSIENIGGVLIEDANESTLLHSFEEDYLSPPFLVIQ